MADGVSGAARRGVLVVGHGSRREEANEDVRAAARRIAARGGFELTQAAFLEIEHPNVAAGFARLVERGARSVTVHPYFLSPGRHTRGDLPVEVREAAARHPGVTYRITEPLSAHRLVIEASIERIRETEGRATSEAEGWKTGEPLSRNPSHAARRGTVYLVGAGPGDPGLLTLKARDLLASCDVVVYDYLVNPEILRHVASHAERVYVGKVGGGRQTPQDEINRTLVAHARGGASVVRLKGGDPFLYGRGGEEAEALGAAGVAFEVVPGISSALAVPAYAGIPLTHRGLSASVAVVTGTRAEESDGSRSLASSAAADTVVVLMGVSRLREIAAELVAAGRSPETPAAVVRWGTYEGQQTVTGTLRTIGDEAERAAMRAPAVIVVGEVVSLRERLRWFESTQTFEAENDLEMAAVSAV
ncbi:MAG TPA: uroporphyrinogen-III C-methyltransferase [Pyrinomonadaceae bacterium]